MELNYLAELYRSQKLGETDEVVHLQGLARIKRWFSLSDSEKQELRKSYLRSTKINFKEEEGLDYVEQSIKVTDYILEFFSKVNYANIKVNEMTSELEKNIFRIYNMLWCEKEYILYLENPRSTKTHVHFEIFSPIIEKIITTKEFSEYKLDVLFKEYKKMIELFSTAYSNKQI